MKFNNIRDLIESELPLYTRTKAHAIYNNSKFDEKGNPTTEEYRMAKANTYVKEDIKNLKTILQRGK